MGFSAIKPIFRPRTTHSAGCSQIPAEVTIRRLGYFRGFLVPIGTMEVRRPVIRIEIEMDDSWIEEGELKVATEDDLIEMVEENFITRKEGKFSVIWPKSSTSQGRGEEDE